MLFAAVHEAAVGTFRTREAGLTTSAHGGKADLAGCLHRLLKLTQCEGHALPGVTPTNVLVRKVEGHEDTIRIENIVAEWPGADKSEARVKGARRSKSIH